jgi:tetratricopeptide (TPR) repeat protein
MIAKNEAGNLPRSLAPVAACFDEVVVLDTGSQDATARMAAALGAKVYQRDWTDDFSAARNCSLQMATADWLLWLDADNALTPQDIGLLRQALPGRGPAILWAREKVVPSGELLWQKRCFPRQAEVCFQGRVHEQLVHPRDWPQVITPVVIQHWGYSEPKAKQAKAAYYLGLLEQSLQENPADFYSRWQAGRCLADQRQFAQAVSYFTQVARDEAARSVNPEIWLHSHLQWARALQRLGRTPEAASVLDRLLGEMPGHGLAHLARGRLAYQQGDWTRAAAHLRQALTLGMGVPLLDLDPQRNLFQAAYYLGRALERLGLLDEAVASLAQACGMEPQNPTSRAELARLLWDQGRREVARSELKQILDNDPSHRQALHLLARWEVAA